ncbi:MAG TPA: MFS transporter [Terriglobales bacterium]|nr:MFS transporter [Terriglobales bacterium]
MPAQDIRLYPRATLALLTGLNLFNYIDRYVLFAVQPLIQAEFKVSDTDLGLLTTGFLICYMVSAPLIGLVADRVSRKWIIIGGAVVWSVATLLTAATYDYRTLFIRHMIVGVGEASFVALAPAFISDLFPEEKRGRALGIFYVAFGMGPGIGYLLGGHLGHDYGWRAPFYVGAIPGVILAAAMMFIPEPKRGATDTIPDTRERTSWRGLFSNGAFWTATFGMAMINFAIGGLSDWMPTFLVRVHGMQLNHANYVFGSITVVNGIAAALLGGWLGDRLLRRTSAAYYMLSAVAMLLAVPIMYVAIHSSGNLMFATVAIGEFLLLLNTSPLNAALVDSVSGRIRASAIALNLFVSHALGDAISPTLIGYISDRRSLQTGFLATIVAVVVGVVMLFYGMRFAPRIHISSSEESTGVTV